MAKRTYAQRRNYMISAVAKRRKKLKEMAVEFKGGKCELCGYDRCVDALDFHHIDAKKKEFGLAKNGLTRAWSRVLKEVQKCVLICSNCHREIHSGIRSIPTQDGLTKTELSA